MNPNELTADDIDGLLREVEDRLRSRGIAASVYLVGGAAIALHKVSTDRRTGDVDGIMVPEAEVLEAAHEVAEVHNLRSNWLNSAATPYVPPLPDEAKGPPTQPGLCPLPSSRRASTGDETQRRAGPPRYAGHCASGAASGRG